jgi:hypothetical protein
MPSGTGATNLRNLPNVSYEINPAKFFALTERNIFAPANFAAPTPGNYTQNQLLQVGVVSKLRFLVQGAVVVGAGASPIPSFKWPYGFFKNVSLSGNGQNNFISCNGFDLYERQRIQNKAEIDTYTQIPTQAQLNVAGTYPFQIQLEVPVAMDDTTLIGSLYAQSEATNLTYTLLAETLANLFPTGTAQVTLTNTAGTAATTPVVFLEETFFEVPYDSQKQGTLIIPDLTVLHGYIGNDNPVASQSLVTTNLIRINGQLERLLVYTDNNNALVITEDISNSSLVYGGSQSPYIFNPQDMLQVRNMIDYKRALEDGVYCLDLVNENPARDQLLLEGVTNLRWLMAYEGDFTPNAAAKVHFVQETLFA